MNIIEIEQLPFSARTSRYKERDKKVTYMFVDEYYSQSIDKKDILLAELEACKELLFDTKYNTDRIAIQAEITQLEAILDMIS
jgi:hypothetical protein